MEYVRLTCYHKALDIYSKLIDENREWFDILIFCDTICVLDGQIVEKPSDIK